jgi:putative GTP pyrophosphokinase
VRVPVEIQLRSIAMDFWASLEHKIYYKYDGEVPDALLQELKEAADTASELDSRMERRIGSCTAENATRCPLSCPCSVSSW